MPTVLPQVEQPRPQETAQKERRRPSVRQIVRSERLAQQGRRRGASVGGIVEQVRELAGRRTARVCAAQRHS